MASYGQKKQTWQVMAKKKQDLDNICPYPNMLILCYYSVRSTTLQREIYLRLALYHEVYRCIIGRKVKINTSHSLQYVSSFQHPTTIAKLPVCVPLPLVPHNIVGVSQQNAGTPWFRQGLLEKIYLEGIGLGCYKQATHLNE